MKATLVICRDPFVPARHRTVATLRRRRRLSALAPKGAPVVCNLNGQWLPRAAWRRRLADGDLVQFIALPQGGGEGGSDMNSILRVVLIAVVSYFTMGAGAVGSGGWAAGSSAMLNAAGTGLSGAGMMVGGAMFLAGAALVNTLIPLPKPAGLDASIGGRTSSPTYSMTAQGNQARLGQPIPVMYGRNMTYPDFAAQPYVEYAGNEQYLYQLFLIGQGKYDVEAVRIEDTPVDNFEEITYEVVAPGADVTLFPTNVVTSTEVAGQEAEYGVALGPFVATDGATNANALAIDIVFPYGMYYATELGQFEQRSVTWTVEAQKIDGSGTPLAGWITLGYESYAATTTTPQRRSYRYGVQSGRYQVRLTRTNTKDTSDRAGNTIAWAGLRAYVQNSTDYGNVTLLAMRMRSSNSLSAQASRKVNVISTRKLKTWSSASGWSATEVATRNPAWALADIWKNADYSVGLSDARIELAGHEALAAVATSRGDTCDIIFDAQTTVMDAATQVARTVRAVPFLQGGVAQVVRDQAQTSPVALFSQRNIVRGSVALQYLMPSEATADAIEVTYWDSSVFAWRQVVAALPGSTQSNVAKVTIPGITNRQRAWQEGMYMAANNRYRRRLVKFRTEMEGFIPAFGDLVALQHDMPRWGQSGEIVVWDEPTRTAILSEPLDWSAGGAHSLSFRLRNGSTSGPYAVVIGTDAYHVVLTDWDPGDEENPGDPTPDTGAERERSHFAFGPSNAQYVLCRVLGIAPKSAEHVELSCVVESDYVHTADTGAAPGDGAWQLPSRFTSPVVAGLIAHSMPDDIDKMVISWQPAPGADHYLLEISAGDGQWTRIGDTSACNFSAVAIYGVQTVVRVAAVGLTRGPWVSINYGGVADYFWDSDASLFWGADANLFWSARA